jgi:TRAP transporter 4TM/12TM fusion protein
MKRVGYGARFAASVEATASLGGQIMPPIMAAAAFIMADFIGVPFRQVALAAVIPALLYFFCVFVTVHLEARRLGLQKVPWADMPSATAVLRQDGYLLLPIVALLWYLYQGFTEETAGLMAIATTYVLSFARRRSALTPERLLRALELSGRIGASVAMAVATAGLIIGCLFLSGIGVQFSYILITLAGGELWVALIYTTFAAFLLGLSLPTTAVYITLAIIIAPALVQMGVPAMAAHFFILYMGVCSDLTPPTCLSPFAAAGIAGSPPMSTAFLSMRLGAVLYIVPFMFVYSPALLMEGTPLDILHATLAAGVGVFCLAAGLQGWVLRAAIWPERTLLLAASITLIEVGLYTDLAGLGLLATAIVSQVLRGRREVIRALSPSLE